MPGHLDDLGPMGLSGAQKKTTKPLPWKGLQTQSNLQNDSERFRKIMKENPAALYDMMPKDLILWHDMKWDAI